VTRAERYLQRLCERSFLRLWSYPGVFRDQGLGKSKEGKEICDLLVVFDNHVIIFSDKACLFPDTGDIAIDWQRWFRRAVLKAAMQVWGAERWIGQFPNRIFMDRACSIPFPVPLPDAKTAKVHRIVVAHGGSQRCQETLGGSGSFMIAPFVEGRAHYDLAAATNTVGELKPFTVGDLDRDKGFVHVFDDASLQRVMTTLDTVSDFVGYLEKKERFLRSGKLGWAAGEEDLMAFYLKYLNAQDEHDFVLPEGVDGILIEEGHFENFQTRPERIAQVSANRVSYTWDSLIEHFIGHTLNQTHSYSNARNLGDHERMYRFMARESRTRRRMLAKALLGIMEKATNRERRARIVQPSGDGDPFYVFLAVPSREDKTNSEYREFRRELLTLYALAVKVKFPEAEDIIGIATEPTHSDDRSEDIIYVDGRDWTEEQWADARHWQRKLRIFEESVRYVGKEAEYPTSTKNWQVKHFRPPEAKNRRNQPCYCGSGKKYKRCCGSNAH